MPAAPVKEPDGRGRERGHRAQPGDLVGREAQAFEVVERLVQARRHRGTGGSRAARARRARTCSWPRARPPVAGHHRQLVEVGGERARHGQPMEMWKDSTVHEDRSPGAAHRRRAERLLCRRRARGGPAATRSIPVLNRLAAHMSALGFPVYASRDWHPPTSRHFADQRWRLARALRGRHRGRAAASGSGPASGHAHRHQGDRPGRRRLLRLRG